MVIKYHHSSLCLSHVLQKMCVIKEPIRKLSTLSYLPKTSYCLMWDRCMTAPVEAWKATNRTATSNWRRYRSFLPEFKSRTTQQQQTDILAMLHTLTGRYYWALKVLLLRNLPCWSSISKPNPAGNHFNGLERPMSGAISAMRSQSGSRELGRGSSSVPFSRIGSSVQSFFGSLASRVQAKPSSVQPSSQTSFAKKMGPQRRSFSTILTSRSRCSNTYTPCFGRYWRRWRLGVPHASDRSKPSMIKPLLPVPKIHL